MIEHRPLITEIPAGKFHSVLMTSYSLNLYYWDIQLLRMLSTKGINYVSALIDSDCLSEQLERFSKGFSEIHTLNFSLHGYKMKGAFHPKIHFYVGRNCVLVLIGSGNLTIAGHGRNLEVWSPIMVESDQNPAYPLIREVWNYLKGLYVELGSEAANIISSLEDNCSLLQNNFSATKKEFEFGSSSIRFFFNQKTSIFEQCQDWIGKETIEKITIMSPFYDRESKLIKALYKQYKPHEINLIVEDNFGSVPKPSSIPHYVTLYKWSNIKKIEGKKFQELFHSKCFFFKGEKNHYLLCGSANASVAAFGTPEIKPKNQEASIGFKSSTTDYFEQTGFKLITPINISDLKEPLQKSTLERKQENTIWIKEVSYFDKSYYITIYNTANEEVLNVSFFTGTRELLYNTSVEIKKGNSEISGSFESPCQPLYVEMSNKNGEIVSNKQFAISIERMYANNPSPESDYSSKRNHAIISGKFINGETLRFIENILAETDNYLSVRLEKNIHKKEKLIDKSTHEFNSFDEYLEDDSTSLTGDRKTRIVEQANTRTSMLFDSIVSYIGKNNKEKLDAECDDEETEDYNLSEGKETKKAKNANIHTTKNIEKVRNRIIKMFNCYFEYLENSISSDKVHNNKIYLSKAVERFTAAVFFLYRTFSYRFILEDGSDNIQTLLELQYTPQLHKTATQHFYHLISAFALYLKNATFEEESEYVARKLDAKKQYAFNLCLAVMAICDWQNNSNILYKSWSAMYRLPAMMNIAKALGVDIKGYNRSNVFKSFDRDIQELDGFDKSNMDNYVKTNLKDMIDYTLYPCSDLFFSNEFWFIRLKKIDPKFAYPCSMAFNYNKKWKEYSPNYLFLYSREQLFKVKPKE